MRPYILGIDPATQTGIAIIDARTGEVLEAYTLKAPIKGPDGKGTATWGARARELRKQFRECCKEYYKDIGTISYEKIRQSSSCFTFIPMIFAEELPHASMTDQTGITPTEWEAYVRKRVDTTYVPVKGMDALDAVRPGLIEEHMIESDDAADAVLIALTFLDKLTSKVNAKKKSKKALTDER